MMTSMTLPQTQIASIDLSDKHSASPFAHLSQLSHRDGNDQVVTKLRKEVNEVNKDNAILQQKVELLELQLIEVKEKYEYLKTNYDKLLLSFNKDQDQINSSRVEYELEVKFLRRENQELKEYNNQHQDYVMKKYQEMNQGKSILEKELLVQQNESQQKLREFEEKDEQNKRIIGDLQFKVDALDKDKQYWQERMEITEIDTDQQLNSMREKHSEDYQQLKNDYEQSLNDIKAIHQKDKQFLDDLLKKSEEKLRKGSSENHNYLEMENKYLRDIKDLNDSFDEYKMQVEKHISNINKEKQQLLKNNEEYDVQMNKLKQTMRTNANHHELNSKRMREKLAKSENELYQKQEEMQKMKNKIGLFKNQIQKMDITEKKLKNLIVNKDSFIQQNTTGALLNMSTNNSKLGRSNTVVPGTGDYSKMKNQSLDANNFSGITSKFIKKCLLDSEHSHIQNETAAELAAMQNCQSTVTSTYDSIWKHIMPQSATNRQKHLSVNPNNNLMGVTYQSRSLTPSNSTPFISHKGHLWGQGDISIQNNTLCMATNANNSIVNGGKSVVMHTVDMSGKALPITESNSASKNFKKVLNFFQPQKKDKLHSQSSKQKIQMRIQLTEDAQKLKVLIENCSKFVCSNCTDQLSYPEMLKHAENGVSCEANHAKNRQSKRSISKKSNLSSNMYDQDGGKRKKSRNRDSVVFKNSFAQHCQNSESLKQGSSYTRKVLSNSILTSDKQMTCNSNSSMQVADEIEEAQQPMVVIHDMDSNCKELEQEIQTLNVMKKNLARQLQQAQEQIVELSMRLQVIEAEKQKNEKEMQNEIRFLLQQIIALKENNTYDSNPRKSQSQAILACVKPMQTQNFTLSLLNSSSSGSSCDNNLINYGSQQQSELLETDNNHNNNQQLYSYRGTRQNSGKMQNTLDSTMENKTTYIFTTDTCENQHKRESKITQKVKQPLTDRMLKYALMDNTTLVNEVDDEHCFSTMSGKGGESRDGRDPIRINDGGFTPNMHHKKNNQTINQTLKQQITKSSSSTGISIIVNNKSKNPKLKQASSGITELVSQRRSQLTSMTQKSGNKTERTVSNNKKVLGQSMNLFGRHK